MKSLVALWLLLAALSPLPAFAQKGLVLYKDTPWEADQFVTATPYKNLEKFPTVHNIVPMTGSPIRVNSPLVVKDIVYPTPASLVDISDEAQVKALEAAIADWKTTMSRFPASAKYLKPRLAQLQAEVAQFHAGKVKSEGVWMTKEALLAKQKKAEEDKRRLAAKLDAEARKLGVLAEEWSGLDEAGRQRARDAKTRAEAAQMQADEERRIQEEIARQERIAAERAKMKPVERLATDTWITPPGLKDEQIKDYEDTLKLVTEELSKAHDDLGFGKEAQRMVLKTAERIYVFKPGDLSPDVQVVQPDGKEKFPTITMESAEHKDVIEAFPKDGSEKVLASSVVLPTAAAVDVEKLTQGLTHLLEICGGKRELAKAQQQ